MSNQSDLPPGKVLLGIEAGGTRTIAAAVDGLAGARRIEIGPANLRLVTDAQLTRHFREISQSMPQPISIAIGMAGARTESDRARIRKAAATIWPGVPLDP